MFADMMANGLAYDKFSCLRELMELKTCLPVSEECKKTCTFDRLYHVIILDYSQTLLFVEV